jgi:hypothetical protein
MINKFRQLSNTITAKFIASPCILPEYKHSSEDFPYSLACKQRKGKFGSFAGFTFHLNGFFVRFKDVFYYG